MVNQNVLVIGGCGFVGSRLVPTLITQGYQVTVLDLQWFGNHLPKECTVINRDASSLESQDLERFDTVIWLAGLSNDAMAGFSPRLNFIHNAALPTYVCYMSKMAGVKRFIHGGSCSTYGFAEGYDHTEEDKVSVTFPYGISKLQAEVGCSQLIDENFSVILLRKGTVGGYSPRMRFDLITNTMYRDAVTKGRITVNNASIWRPILALSDAVHAYMKAITAPQSISGTFNIMSENHTVIDVAMKVADTFKASITVNNLPDSRNYKVSGHKAAKILGYKPQGSVQTIINELCDHHDEFGDFTRDEYHNINTFKKIFHEI